MRGSLAWRERRTRLLELLDDHDASSLAVLDPGGRALTRLGVSGTEAETAVDELMSGLVVDGRPLTIVVNDLHSGADGF